MRSGSRGRRALLLLGCLGLFGGCARFLSRTTPEEAREGGTDRGPASDLALRDLALRDLALRDLGLRDLALRDGDRRETGRDGAKPTDGPAADLAALDQGPPKLPHPIWSRGFGGPDADLALCAVDAVGNMAVGGAFSGTIDLGDGPLVAAGFDIALASYAPDGTHRFSKRLGGSGYDGAESVAVDSAGNIYLAGTVYGTVDLGGGPRAASGLSTFVASFTSTGTHRWSKLLASRSGISGSAAIAVDGAELTVAAPYAGAPDLGGGALPNAGLADVFVASFDTATGAHRWSQHYGSASADGSEGIAVAAGGGNVFLAGSYRGTVAIGTSTTVSKGYSDVLVASYTSAGSLRWWKTYGGTDNDFVHAIAVDPAGRSYLTGRFYQSVDFGAGAISPSPPNFSDIFLLSLDASGGFRWVKQYGSTKIETAYAIAVDQSGGLILSGEFEQAIDFGGGVLTAQTYQRAFVASLASTGAYRWALALSTTTGSEGRSLGLRGSEIYLAGTYWGIVDFGQGPLPAASGLANAFILKLAP